MWDRSILKGNARLAISGNKYWTAYAACVICTLITGIFSIIQGFTISSAPLPTATTSTEAWRLYMDQISKSSRFFLLTILFSIFVGNVLLVGLSRFFVHNRFGDTKLETLFSGFGSGYGSTVGTMFVTDLFTILWFLLLIVPGIIKVLQYWMVPFILSDNPHMPGKRARQISRMMTDGEKGSILVLYLSFLGWYILAGLAIWIAGRMFSPISTLASIVFGAFVTVYVKATFAELYIFLRDRALQSGMVQAAELGLVPPAE